MHLHIFELLMCLLYFVHGHNRIKKTFGAPLYPSYIVIKVLIIMIATISQLPTLAVRSKKISHLSHLRVIALAFRLLKEAIFSGFADAIMNLC